MNFKRFIFYSLLVPMTVSCPKEINPPEPSPDGVRIKPSSGLASPSETGTRSLPSFQNQVRVEWSTVNSLDNLIEEYIVYRSISLDSQFVTVGNRVVTASESDSFWVDDKVFNDTTYYYFVVARDSKDNFSDTASYFTDPGYIAAIRLGEKVFSFISPPTDTASAKPVFTWCLSSQPPVAYYVKVATPSQQVIWIAQKQNGTFDADCFNPNNHEYLTFHNVSYSANDSLLVKTTADVTVHFINPAFFNGGRLKKESYLWRVDCDFGDSESKSGWTPFTVTKD